MLSWYKVLEKIELDQNKIAIYGLLLVKVHSKTICLVRNQEGYYAIQNFCPHAGGDLSQGWCEGRRIVCPVHRYAYDLKTGRGIADQGDAVKTYPLEIRDDGLFIGLNDIWSLFNKK